MAELFKGIAGSPITYLTNNITATQTTIAVDNENTLPPAPNICTIGYGENIETIKYGIKSNGVLQEVVRGIEGTPRAWPAGTEVARFFTAYDHNAIIDDFVAHKAESAKKHITESGSLGVERGHYIKFDDGTLICRITRNKMTTVEPNTVSVVNWVFPAAFVGGVPTVLPAVQMGSTIYTANANVIKEDSLLQTDIAVKHNNPNPVLVGLRIIAIGRWK